MGQYATKWLQEARYWFDQPSAQIWQRLAVSILTELQPRLVGFRGLQLGVTSIARRMPVVDGPARIWRADVVPTPGTDLCINGRNLPLATHSMDSLMLLHALELSSQPEFLLRECERVLSKRGQLLCLVFNPWLSGALKYLPTSRFYGLTPVTRPPRLAKLRSWLQALALEPVEIWGYGPGLPGMGRGYHKRLGTSHGHWPTTAAYAVLARRYALPRQPPSAGGKRLARRRGVLA